jgi:Chemotaxis protein; stimulates methylation of MCP proteins
MQKSFSLQWGLPRVEVQPGDRYATKEPTDIKTLLGSCVAACLYDSEAKVAGLNHFLLAAPRYSRDMPFTATDAGRYGIHAMELLITDMQKLGASRSRLRAKVFGGASVLGLSHGDKFLCVNEVNIRFIRDYLATERIPIVSEDLGGNQGRVIHFHSDSYRVFRRFIQKSETEKIENVEHHIWEKAIETPKPSEGEAILF